VEANRAPLLRSPELSLSLVRARARLPPRSSRMTSTNSVGQPAAVEMPQGFDFYMQVLVRSLDRSIDNGELQDRDMLPLSL